MTRRKLIIVYRQYNMMSEWGTLFGHRGFLLLDDSKVIFVEGRKLLCHTCKTMNSSCKLFPSSCSVASFTHQWRCQNQHYKTWSRTFSSSVGYISGKDAACKRSRIMTKRMWGWILNTQERKVIWGFIPCKADDSVSHYTRWSTYS